MSSASGPLRPVFRQMKAVLPRKECPSDGERGSIAGGGEEQAPVEFVFSWKERPQFTSSLLRNGFKRFLREGIFSNRIKGRLIIMAVTQFQ